jgi:hypothetical protein
MRIVITQQDIENGQPGVPSCCPIALAAQRVYNCPVTVDGESFSRKTQDSDEFGHYDYWVSYDLPKSARDFVAAFDAEWMVAPFEFDGPDKLGQANAACMNDYYSSYGDL